MVQFLIDRARRQLDPQRVLHVLGVTHTITALAAIHELDLTDAALAGLLHDQSKEMPQDQLLTEMRQMGVIPDHEDLAFPNTWHGLHAAAYARKHWGLDRPAVYEAVKLHTTADEGIGPLTKALFIADLCEPTRKVKEVQSILKAAKQDLDEGFRQAIVHKMRHVMSKKKSALHPRAVRALKAYVNLEPRHLMGESEKKQA